MKRQAGLASEHDTMKYFDFTFEEWEDIPESAQMKLRGYVRHARISLGTTYRTPPAARATSA